MNKKLSWLLLSTLLGGAVLTGCSEENPKPTNGEGDQNPTSKNPTELYYANMFGKEAMSTYYYWNKEINSDLNNWNIETNNDPIGTVDQIRYHQGINTSTNGPCSPMTWLPSTAVWKVFLLHLDGI